MSVIGRGGFEMCAFGCQEWNQVTRRDFLRRSGGALGALALGDALLGSVAASYAQSVGGTGNLLVLCELAGGLDALSFIAPFTNAAGVFLVQ